MAAPNDEGPTVAAATPQSTNQTTDAGIVAQHDGPCLDKVRHPLSAAFGDMPADEFAELVRDIKRNGQINAIVKAADGSILDGWHRYRACIAAGIRPLFEPLSYIIDAATESVGRTMTEAEFVVAQNAHRRHLTAEQRRKIVGELLKADPAKSDRAIGSMAKVDHKTVAAVRRKVEATGEIPQLTKTTGKDGKARTKPAGQTLEAKVKRAVAAADDHLRSMEGKPHKARPDVVDVVARVVPDEVVPQATAAPHAKAQPEPAPPPLELRASIISAAQAARFENTLDECAKELRRIGGRTKSRRRASLADVSLARSALGAALRELPALAGEVEARSSIAGAAHTLAAAFDTTEPIKAADRAAMDKLRRVLWTRCSSVKKLGNSAAIEAAIAGLVEQGKRNAATVSITTVGILAQELKAALLDQLLMDASSDRTITLPEMPE